MTILDQETIDWIAVTDRLHDAAIKARDARIARLEAGIANAIEMVEHWGGYADKYFKDKWDLPGDVAELRALLPSSQAPVAGDGSAMDRGR